MKHLRRYIRSIIKEAMISLNTLGDDWAVWANWYEDSSPPAGTELNFILYNRGGAEKQIRALAAAELGEDIDAYEVVEAIESQVYAVIRARVPDVGYGECNSAWEIIRSAAEKGYGPTLYDLVMSISPRGLTSDRSEVSGDAKKVWSHYANNRSNVDKQLLDPDGNFTTTEEDDCTMQGTGPAWDRSPMPKLHHQMAIDFLEDNYSEEYEDWLAQQDPSHLEDLKWMDGDDYCQEVFSSIEKTSEEWDLDEAQDEWYTWKMENELELIDNLEGDVPDHQTLNLSYNTDYASDTMTDLIGNHFNWISNLEDEMGWTLGIDEEHLNFAVRDFFKEKYQ